jgi:hypothetical protein
VTEKRRGRLERAPIDGAVRRPLELRRPVIGRWVEQQQGTGPVEGATCGAECCGGVFEAPEHVFVKVGIRPDGTPHRGPARASRSAKRPMNTGQTPARRIAGNTCS